MAEADNFQFRRTLSDLGESDLEVSPQPAGGALPFRVVAQMNPPCQFHEQFLQSHKVSEHFKWHGVLIETVAEKSNLEKIGAHEWD